MHAGDGASWLHIACMACLTECPVTAILGKGVPESKLPIGVRGGEHKTVAERDSDVELKPRACHRHCTAYLFGVSTVELAVRKVKKLSNRQARELLGWLAERQPNGTSRKQPVHLSRGQRKAHPSMKKLLAWYDSIRGTTDWEPPRMPDDPVKATRL